jgi:hypothetical protein
MMIIPLTGRTRPVTRLRADQPQRAVGSTITLTLTDARPMRVRKDLWPIIAKASQDRDHNNQEIFRRHYLRVRMHGVRVGDADRAVDYYGGDKGGAPLLAPHPDGRVVVVGWYESSYRGEHGAEAGYVTTLEEAPAIIRQVGEAIGAPEHLITECCGDLPPVDESGETGELADALSVEQLESAIARKKS